MADKQLVASVMIPAFSNICEISNSSCSSCRILKAELESLKLELKSANEILHKVNERQGKAITTRPKTET